MELGKRHPGSEYGYVNLVLITFFLLFIDFVVNGQQKDSVMRSRIHIEHSVVGDFDSTAARIFFIDSTYTQLKGITTFRGNSFRNAAAVGKLDSIPSKISIEWSFETSQDKRWLGGAGWTGQPMVVQWPDSIRKIMNINAEFIDKEGFVEVVIGSLDGKIYFIDLETGKASRPAIDTKNPIKGSGAIDPRGYPLLYMGQGIANTDKFGLRIFSLMDQSQLYFLNGRDSDAYRTWAAFDGSPLISSKDDQMIVGGENGVVYSVKLNTKWDSLTQPITVNPQVLKYRYKIDASKQGIENSVAAYKNSVYFADNHGHIQSVRLDSLKHQWVTSNHDDTDATIVIEEEDGKPFLYTGNEVDIQGNKGNVYLKKLDGVNGNIVWEREVECLTVKGERPVNGGMLSTPVLGKHNSDSLVIFSLSRYKKLNAGLLIALDKRNGEIIWEVTLPNYSWSSPLDVYDAEGNMYIFQADSGGYIHLLNGSNGEIIYEEKIASLFEASPVAFDNKIIIAARPDRIFCLTIE